MLSSQVSVVLHYILWCYVSAEVVDDFVLVGTERAPEAPADGHPSTADTVSDDVDAALDPSADLCMPSFSNLRELYEVAFLFIPPGRSVV